MEQINLNIIPDGVMPVCHASQFDKNRTIRFNLKDNGSVYTLAGTETITCKVRKPDDTENTINVANTSSSYVDVTFGLGDTDLSGYAMCELKIVKGTQTIGSRNFLLNIEADAFDGSKFEERSASGAIASFETNYIDNLNELIVNITATQAGSGTPSTPRAISGWSECNVTRCGKNLLNPTLASDTSAGLTAVRQSDKSYSLTGTATSTAINIWLAGNYIVNPSTQLDNNKLYYIAAGTTITYKDCKLFFYDVETGQPNVSFGQSNVPIGSGAITITVPHNAWLTGVRLPDGVKGTAYNTTLYPQIELGTTATAYEQYNGNTYTFALGQTVYGGTLNVTTGELTITHGYVDLGSLTWTLYAGNRWVSNLVTGMKPNSSNYRLSGYLCDSFSEVTADQLATDTTLIGFSINTVGNIAVRTGDENTPTGAIVYELATPITAQLTPTEVRTLLENNIFADTGDVVSCKYLVEVT